MFSPAFPCYVARDLLLHELRWVRMVPIFDCCPIISLLDSTQSGGLVENQAILDENREQDIYWDHELDCSSHYTTNCQQLLVLQQP
jgi:hypothetical protein